MIQHEMANNELNNIRMSDGSSITLAGSRVVVNGPQTMAATTAIIVAQTAIL